MLAGMTARQFTEWKAFFKIENERIQAKVKEGSGGKSPVPTGGTMEERLKSALTDVGARNEAKERNARKRSEGQSAP